MDLMKLISSVDHFVEDTKELDFELFLAVVAMTLEERCKTEGADMIETVKKLLVAARRVNAALGKY